ncbi:MAG: hypothetical protein JJE25_15580 [Bacteroidia bacterium]|nr:hypothetical protein [Bacteroidia bacterium]
MNRKNQTDALHEAITLLEIIRAEELKSLKQQFHLTYESLKPFNLIKSTFKDAVASGKEALASPDLKDNVLNTSVGLAAGYLSKRLFVGVSNSPLRKILGFALQFGITTFVAKNPEGIKSFGKGLVNIVKSKLGTNNINGQHENESYSGNY